MTFVLEVIAGPHAGARFEINRHETFLVGRDRGANLPLTNDPHFSRRHFLLEVSPPLCHLRDLDSRNGTRLNGERVQQAMLRDGDVISGGKTQLKVSITGAETVSFSCASCGAGTRVDRPANLSPDANATLCPECRELAAAQPQGPPGYELLRKLGRGGMGVVHLGRRLSTGELAAIKTIIPEAAMGQAAVQLFLREASVLSQLEHRRIVRFWEIGYTRGTFFLAMEYVATIDLTEYLARLELDRKVRIACGFICQALEALAYAHGRGVVHRDVKPANLLLSRSGKRLRIRLADFGLAKKFEDGGFSGITRQGDVRGSLPFMPPEQIIDCRLADPAGDIYATGASLYYLLAGEFPHEFAANCDRYAVVLEQSPVPLQQRMPGVAAELAAHVHRSLAANPQERFPTADALRAALLPFALGKTS